MPTVEYCLANVDGPTRERLADFDAEVDADVVEKRCLQRCGDCIRGPFIVVDGDVETGDSHADLLTGRE